ncbi:MAG: 50S ribosomal protein L4 [Thermoplasmatota archaeon]
MAKVTVYGLNGSKKESITLPKIFSTIHRPDIIKKSFNTLSSNRRHPYGAYPLAGAQHATASVGKGRGMSRVPRLTQGNAAALAPCVVGGRRAHPPTSKRNWHEKINKKEKKLARKSALAATADKDLVSKRGHLFDESISLPIIVDDAFEQLKKTKDVLDAFDHLGISDDVIRARNGKHIRAGKGKGRGRKYKTPKSILIISDHDSIRKAAQNIIGVDVVAPKQVNINHLAPGGVSGRLTVITKSALSSLEDDN